jgi:hypothetical protein
MPRKYSDEAVDYCFQLWLRHNGENHDLIEAAMRKVWPGWSKQNLYERGAGANHKDGWIVKYGWENALKIKRATSARQAATSAEKLFLEIEQQRERIKTELDGKGSCDKDLIYQHRDYCKLSIDALARLAASGNNIDAFVAMWERLMRWLPDISVSATRELLAVSDQVLERAKVEYSGATA